MIARILLALAAAGAILLGAARLSATNACDAAWRAARTAPRPERAVQAMERRCRGAEQLVGGAAALQRAGEQRQALAAARLAAAREPDNYLTWVAVWVSARSLDPAAAERARLRAHELNPRYPPTA